MLEFQDEFFNQEIRDGFYLDTTMKTLWAAELEILQKVAEVCDRHGLKWYAAYGTLLGAIRHEGFVPWDDDMDIWVKRPDYNILMQVLPKELPEGYLVRGPLTDEGYDQFHTCINNGSGISIAKEWLDQYHGCPFTVGLDIFPLDYLTRNEKDRELQVNLLTMTGRIAQLAKMLGRGDYDSKEDEPGQKNNRSIKKEKESRKKKGKTQKDSIIEEINLGISYLEENCRLQIDHQLLNDEKWGKVSSELWKWANYLAMMYGEEDGDNLVEFLDYIQCPHKIYPKEWFADGYSADFENFMIPIPAGYDNILKYIYGLSGNYHTRIKKSATHEYPFYARQLRQLREYVKNIQQRAQDVGLVSIDEIEIKEETKELPSEWLPLTYKADGSRKKIILSANDPEVYIKYGDKALDKLAETLQTLERAKNSVLLWWRPQPVMKKVLDQVSPDLGGRYQEILDRYKESGWGICDETDHIDRAVEICDVYYGEMNAIIQPFQNQWKAVMISSVTENGEEWKKNAERINEYRTFISMSDFAADEKYIYFSNTNCNSLVIANKKTGEIVKHIPWEGCQSNISKLHIQCVRLKNNIYFLPARASYMHIYNVKSGAQKICNFLGKEETISKELPARWLWGYYTQEKKVYLLPFLKEQGLWSITEDSDDPSKEDWWDIPSGDSFLRHEGLDANRFFTWEVNGEKLYITNVSEQKIVKFLLPDKEVQHVVYDGMNFWYTIKCKSDIVCWNQDRGVIDRYAVSYDPYYVLSPSYGIMSTYGNIYYAEGHLFLLSGDCKYLYLLDRATRELQTLHVIECARGSFLADDLIPSFKRIGNLLICMLRNAGEMLIIHLDNLDVRQEIEVFHAESAVRESIYKQCYTSLLDRSALLVEEKGTADLDLLIQYCMEKQERS